MEQHVLVCMHTHSEVKSFFFPPRGGKGHKQCGALSSLLKMKVLQKAQPQLSNYSTGKPVYQFTAMMCRKNGCETLATASAQTFTACQRLHLYLFLSFLLWTFEFFSKNCTNMNQTITTLFYLHQLILHYRQPSLTPPKGIHSTVPLNWSCAHYK